MVNENPVDCLSRFRSSNPNSSESLLIRMHSRQESKLTQRQETRHEEPSEWTNTELRRITNEIEKKVCAIPKKPPLLKVGAGDRDTQHRTNATNQATLPAYPCNNQNEIKQHGEAQRHTNEKRH